MYPVVLHHGLCGHGDLKFGPLKISAFSKIDLAIKRLGHPLIVTHVHPTSSIVHRAGQLKDIIIQRVNALGRAGQKVILMAHSMGGLDARYAVTKLGLDKYVAAVVTVTTPHRGSPFADWMARNFGRRMRGYQIANLLGLDLQGGHDLTTEQCAAFNESVPDVPGLKYYSVSAARPWTKMPPFAMHSHHVIRSAEGDNDGLVSVKSSIWGEHNGVWQADHWHTINRRFVPECLDETKDISPHWVALLNRVKAGLGISEA